ncbi:hypothetical protein [Limibacterium fermenti]|uniref:hypothetical protein n=1 Tax=Limibacterium fermenti TaxID=3229863 RepID=UPI000E8D28FC|nr:hypothetical protein [Porphyromonadaceae bacterium]
MNAISLEVRKRKIVENLSIVDDISAIEQIENILKSFTSTVNRFTVEELEERAARSEKAIEEGRVYTVNEVRNKLGL